MKDSPNESPTKDGRLIVMAAGVAIVLLVAALTHLVAILILPRVATKDAVSLLRAQYPNDAMGVLARAKPDDTLIPFRDPATVQGVCFFDLSKGPVRVKTVTEEGRLLTLSFRTPDGRIFYSMTDRAAFHDTIDIRLVTEEQLRAVEANDDEDEGLPAELRLKVPSLTGVLVATALIARPSEAQDAEARIKAIGCAPEPMPQR